MTSKLIHLHNSTSGIVPGTDELVVGQIAINAADAQQGVRPLLSDPTVTA